MTICGNLAINPLAVTPQILGLLLFCIYNYCKTTRQILQADLYAKLSTKRLFLLLSLRREFVWYLSGRLVVVRLVTLSYTTSTNNLSCYNSSLGHRAAATTAAGGEEEWSKAPPPVGEL